jgi:hypothetical protein
VDIAELQITLGESLRLWQWALSHAPERCQGKRGVCRCDAECTGICMSEKFAELLADLDHWRRHELVRSAAGTSTVLLGRFDADGSGAALQRRHLQRKDDGGISMQARCVAAQFYEATGPVSPPTFNGSPR